MSTLYVKSIEEFKQVIESSVSLTEVLNFYKLPHYSNNYNLIKKFALDHNITISCNRFFKNIDKLLLINDNDLCKLISNCYNCKEVCKLLHLSSQYSSKITQRKKQLGVSYKKRKNITKGNAEWFSEEILFLKKEYLNFSLSELQSKFLERHSIKSIKRKKTELKLKKPYINNNSSIYKLAENTHEAFYWIGFILADGHLSKKYSRLDITLSEKDKIQLENFKKFIDYKFDLTQKPASVGYENRKNLWKISVQNKSILNKIIEKYNINSNKTENPPLFSFYKKFDNKLLLSLLIGFIDGDGYIANQTGRKDFFIKIENHGAWLEFLTNFALLLQSEFQINKIALPKINKRGYANFVISNNRIIHSLVDHIEKNNLPILKRKWSKINADF